MSAWLFQVDLLPAVHHPESPVSDKWPPLDASQSGSRIQASLVSRPCQNNQKTSINLHMVQHVVNREKGKQSEHWTAFTSILQLHARPDCRWSVFPFCRSSKPPLSLQKVSWRAPCRKHLDRRRSSTFQWINTVKRISEMHSVHMQDKTGTYKA